MTQIERLLHRFNRLYERFVTDPDHPETNFPLFLSWKERSRLYKFYEACKEAGLGWQTHVLAGWLGLD